MFELTSEPVIISCAITGNKTTRAMNPNLPLTPLEQGIAAAESGEVGSAKRSMKFKNEPLRQS